MVKIGLQLQAQLENLTNLTADGEDFRWYLKLKCANCGEISEEFVYLDQLNSQPLKGGRGQASLVIKCKLCSRENSIDILKESIQKYTHDDSGQFKTIVAFDCRGTEPVEFEPRIGWTADGHTEDGGESGTHFTEVSLVEKEWADYDEKSNESVGIYEVESKFIKMGK